MWIAPIQLLLAAYFLSLELGWAASASGIMVFILFLPIQVYFGKKASELIRSAAIRTDGRLQLMNQILHGIQVLKMYVWEKPFSDLLGITRRRELNAIRRYSIIYQLVNGTDLYIPRTAIFLTILAFILIKNGGVSAERVYMITIIYDILRESISRGFGPGALQMAKLFISFQRFEEFMSNTEIKNVSMINNCNNTNSSSSSPIKDYMISFKGASAKWNNELPENALKNLDFTVKTGSLMIIIGRIGSSKSSLLHAILGELPLAEGSMEIRGKLVYVSQQRWLFASSVKQNILFGETMDEQRYEEVLKVCQLTTDLQQLTHGDQTIIGERVIVLSGGQRARINLARAVYADSDIILMDDPLSAVDPHVGQRIIDECINGYLKNKTRILVTHQLQFLKYADRVIVLDNGNIIAQGNYDELQASGLDFIAMCKDKLIDSKQNNVEENGDDSCDESIGKVTRIEHAAVEKIPIENTETKKSGTVSSAVYLSYFSANKNVPWIVIMLLALLIYPIASYGGDYFIAVWINSEETATLNKVYSFNWLGPLSRDHFIYIYSGFIVITIIFASFQVVAYYIVCMRSSENLHLMMFDGVVRSHMYFFNTNPVGRILNRFSEDMGTVDFELPEAVFDVIVISLMGLAVCLIIAVVNPWLINVILITGIIIFIFAKFYLSTSRSIKRISCTTRSPLFDYVGATLQGLITIRAFKTEKILTREFDNHQDLNSTASLIHMSLSNFCGLYMELICIICSCVLAFMLLFLSKTIKVGDVGLIITQCLSVTMLLHFAVKQITQIENHMTSVERILEYSELEEESQLDSKPDKKPLDDWPSGGCIKFVDVKIKYDPEGSYVLENINFVIQSSEKIGVVGRTGAGKSSLINALFRLAYVEGDILIDNISTGSIGLHDYRSKISIIPQEPIIFSGSLRRNLDPFEEYSNDVIWRALDEVQLKDTISAMDLGLHSVVSEDGSNFSVGQRQLLCLARAILRNNKIMILDEATANVDPETDSKIQKTIGNTFRNCTVVTIAHRLNTVMNSDKILVMDGGRIVEYDHPYILLKRKAYLYDMIQRTGYAMATIFTETAKKNYTEKYSENN